MESSEAKTLILLASESPRSESTLNDTLGQARGPEHNYARLWESKRWLRIEGLEQLSSTIELMIRFICRKRGPTHMQGPSELNCFMQDGWRRSRDWTSNYFRFARVFNLITICVGDRHGAHLSFHWVGIRRTESTRLCCPSRFHDQNHERIIMLIAHPASQGRLAILAWIWLWIVCLLLGCSSCCFKSGSRYNCYNTRKSEIATLRKQYQLKRTILSI